MFVTQTLCVKEKNEQKSGDNFQTNQPIYPDLLPEFHSFCSLFVQFTYSFFTSL